jgi:hypothetical protein
MEVAAQALLQTFLDRATLAKVNFSLSLSSSCTSLCLWEMIIVFKLMSWGWPNLVFDRRSSYLHCRVLALSCFQHCTIMHPHPEISIITLLKQPMNCEDLCCRCDLRKSVILRVLPQGSLSNFRQWYLMRSSHVENSGVCVCPDKVQRQSGGGWWEAWDLQGSPVGVCWCSHCWQPGS